MQIIGLGALTYVVLMFFTQMGMEPLLWSSVAGVTFFYGGTLILGKSQT
jgi:hypothetical protein